MSIDGNRYHPKGITKIALIQANIPLDYWDISLSSYKGPRDAVILAVDYLDRLEYFKKKGIGLLFAGKSGTGKTCLMAVVLKYLIRARWKCYMSSLSELVEVIKRSWDTKDTTEVDRCKYVDFLGIDDLGKEHVGPTGFSATTFDNLLRYRTQHCLPTLFTTNLNKAELRNRYGTSTLSLIEGKCKVIPVQGADYRQSILKHELS